MSDIDAKQIRVTIRHVGSGPNDRRFVPATVFNKFFGAFFRAAKVARASLSLPRGHGELVITDLRMGSNIFAFGDTASIDNSAICLLNKCIDAVNRSEFSVAVTDPKLAKALVGIGRAYNPEFDVLADCGVREIYVDEHFSRRAHSLSRLLSPELSETHYFAGRSIETFVGVLSELNSFHGTWTAWLKLEGGKKIECILDKAKGEAHYAECWNKRVYATGTAVYTGESLLPESLTITHIETLAPSTQVIDMRGSISHFDRSEWDNLGDIKQH